MKNLIGALDAVGPGGLGPLDGQTRARVLMAIEAFETYGPDAKAGVRSAIDQGLTWRLLSWAEGNASLAVRRVDRDLVLHGLVGLSLFDQRDFDPRDVLVVFFLYVRASRLIGVDIDDLIRAAAKRTDSAGASWLIARTAADRDLVLATHKETGAGPSFLFARNRAGWDPLTELADLM